LTGGRRQHCVSSSTSSCGSVECNFSKLSMTQSCAVSSCCSWSAIRYSRPCTVLNLHYNSTQLCLTDRHLATVTFHSSTTHSMHFPVLNLHYNSTQLCLTDRHLGTVTFHSSTTHSMHFPVLNLHYNSTQLCLTDRHLATVTFHSSTTHSVEPALQQHIVVSHRQALSHCHIS